MYRRLHSKTVTLAIAVFLFQLCNPSFAEVKNEHKVKAAIVYKLLRYISWPEEASQSATINLCVDQNDPFFTAFSDVDGRKVRNRKIVLKDQPQDVSSEECQIVFISADGQQSIYLAEVKAKMGVLTISDSRQFAERGGMINLLVKNDRVRFKINPHAAYQSRLRINSSLLRMADIVETENQSAANLHVDSEAFE
ncbi:MAG: YfiR family protein [Pseudomonadales bacterium]